MNVDGALLFVKGVFHGCGCSRSFSRVMTCCRVSVYVWLEWYVEWLLDVFVVSGCVPFLCPEMLVERFVCRLHRRLAPLGGAKPLQALMGGRKRTK